MLAACQPLKQKKNMFKTLTKAVAVLTAILMASCGSQPFTMEGTVESSIKEVFISVGVEGDYDTFLPEEKLTVTDSKFTYQKDITEIVPARIRKDNSFHITVYLVPGEKLNLDFLGYGFKYDGSGIYRECRAADQAITPARSAMDDCYQYIYGAKTQEEKMAYQDTLNRRIEEYYGKLVSYFNSKKDVEGAVLFLSGEYSVDNIYNGISQSMKQGRVGKFLKSRIDHAEKMRAIQESEEQEEMSRINAMNGTLAKDFTLNDLDGNPLSLSSLRGKYVVLDFWGSWCGWCIKGFPDMKKYYQKYKGKLEILGIDCNDSDEAWRAAVKKHGLPWLHVYNPKESSLVNDYNVPGFPTKIVIDPAGKIIKVIVGEDPEFYTYLDGLF